MRTLTALLLLLCVQSCQTIDLYEKHVTIPNHEWKSSFKPQFQFTITDTTAAYQLFIVLRHTDKYNFNNIWLNLYAQAPGTPSRKFGPIEMPLAAKESGWLGTGMDDLYDHRVALSLDPAQFHFKKAGTYVFTIEQAMREDPLTQVLNVGLRIEKQKP
ncbi:MAG TPA: gliding motility lipoprotein GldH [Flavisolibacter sp.]|nr:gliding motility lipoprotein GldH [Flavisolibacter sp.]